MQLKTKILVVIKKSVVEFRSRSSTTPKGGLTERRFFVSKAYDLKPDPAFKSSYMKKLPSVIKFTRDKSSPPLFREDLSPSPDLQNQLTKLVNLTFETYT